MNVIKKMKPYRQYMLLSMVKSICIKFTYLIAQYYFVPLNQHAMQFSGSFINSTFSKLKSY